MPDPKTPAEKDPKIGPAPDGGIKVPPGAPKEVIIKADAPPPEPEDAEDDPSAPPETRTDRRNARAATRQAEQAKEEARLAREDALLAKAKLQAQQVHIDGLKAVMPQAPSQTDKQLEEMTRQQEAILTTYQARQAAGEKISPEEAQRIRAQYQGIGDARHRLIAQSVQPQFSGPNQQQIQQMIQEAQLKAKYPDVFGDETALAFANALSAKYQREGKFGPDAVDQVMNETRRRLGLGKAANGAAHIADNARFQGVPTGAAPMAGKAGRYVMTAAEQKMAHKQYDKDPPEVAEQKWANSTGKKLLAKGK